MIKEYDQLVKLILVGTSGVGKSSVLGQFADNKFDENYFTTIGVDFRFKTLRIDNRNIKFQIWDTAGQERFRTITSAYYKGADGVIVVYDVTQPQTFEEISSIWVPEIESYADKDINVLVLGNKSDCQRKVRTDSASGFARQKGYDFEEVSAKTADKIFESIRDFGRKVADRKSRKLGSSAISEPTTSKILSQAAKSAPKEKSCC